MMALPVEIGPLQASIAVDMGAAVNVLSEETYLPLKRVSRGSRWSLNPNDLNIVAVNITDLELWELFVYP